MLLICLVFLGQVANVELYLRFQNLIPNGRNVPHTCMEKYIWHGVGHQRVKGGGALNAFGRDFMKVQKVWKKLCPLDSDGDGLTNGQELGDPKCKWTEDQMPDRTVNITHPGICDAFDSPMCRGRNYFLKCEKEVRPCDVLDEEGIKNITLRMPKTMVPAQRTTYMHTFFELPQDGDYHLVAAKPFIDNNRLVHHMDVFGCDEFDGPVNVPFRSPQIDTAWPKCSNMMAGWSVGFSGTCYDGEYGVRFGAKKGYKIALLEVHLDNADGDTNIMDSSGVTLYYTSKRRKFDSGVIQIGQLSINIPPRMNRVVVSGVCSSSCTKSKMSGPIYIASMTHHMHYTGLAAKSELFRNGSKVATIKNDEHFNYDSPVEFKLKKAIKMLPGDEIKMTCLYTSKYKTTTTHYGQGVDGEMCYGYFSFYPIENSPLSRCIGYGAGDFCTY